MAATEVFTHKGTDFWQSDPGHWTVLDRGLIVAEAQVKTTRTRREDWSGRKAFRVIIRSDAQVTIKLLNNFRVFIGTFNEAGEAVSAMRSLIDAIQSGAIWQTVIWQLAEEARKAGKSEFQILNTWDDDPQRQAINLSRLLK